MIKKKYSLDCVYFTDEVTLYLFTTCVSQINRTWTHKHSVLYVYVVYCTCSVQYIVELVLFDGKPFSNAVNMHVYSP